MGPPRLHQTGRHSPRIPALASAAADSSKAPRLLPEPFPLRLGPPTASSSAATTIASTNSICPSPDCRAEILDGLRIAQLSDIHIGAYISAPEVRRAGGLANELAPDLSVVTGDFITTARTIPLEACISELAALRAPLRRVGLQRKPRDLRWRRRSIGRTLRPARDEASAPGERRDRLARRKIQSNRRRLPTHSRS